MQRSVLLIISIILFCDASYSQTIISAVGCEIVLTKPDTSVWHLVQQTPPKQGSKGVMMFKHEPMKDSLNRPVEPVIALVYENLSDSIDVMKYSANLISTKPFSVRHHLLGGYPDYSSDKHSVVFEGEYINVSVKHKVMLGYILFKHLGIELIGDATDQVYDKVRQDMQKFIKSVSIKS